MSRSVCQQCQRPEGLCYCDSIIPVTNSTRVTIVQHPLEQNHPFNTGRIAELALSNCEIIISEQLSVEKINVLTTPNSVLVYPELAWLPESPPLPVTIDQLVVLDATWKKSKKILHLNPALQNLPRFSISASQPSTYQIRSSSQPDGLATIEAICKALNRLEAQPVNDLLVPFETMISRQQQIAAKASGKD